MTLSFKWLAFLTFLLQNITLCRPSWACGEMIYADGGVSVIISRILDTGNFVSLHIEIFER